MTEPEKEQAQYNLSILISQDGFSFSIYQSGTRYVTEFASEDFNHIQSPHVLLEKVEQTIRKYKLSVYAFNDIAVYYQTHKYLFCPDELFREDQVPQLFTLSHELGELDEVRHVHSTYLHARVIFSMPTELVTLLLKHFENCNIYPAVWSHLNYLKSESRFVLLHIAPTMFDMMVVKDYKLHHLNSFSYHVNNDFLYFTLNTLKQLNLESKTMPVYMQGDITRFDQKFLQLKQFIPNVTMVNTKAIKGSVQLTGQLKLKNWILFNPLCA